MKFWEVLSKAGNILKYLRRRRKEKLYHQWVERSGLPPEALPQEVAGDITPKMDGKKRHLYILYVLLGVSIVLLCLGLILLAMQSC